MTRGSKSILFGRYRQIQGKERFGFIVGVVSMLNRGIQPAKIQDQVVEAFDGNGISPFSRRVLDPQRYDDEIAIR